MIRILIAALVAVLAVPLVGAAPPGPRPVVVVYPFTGGAGVAPNIGDNIALVIALQLSQSGDVTVKSPPAGTAQSDFLTTARSLGADYYVAGLLSPIGTQIAVIEQLVSARNGVSVWRNTATISVPDDARDSALQLHQAIVALGTQQVPSSVAAAPPPPPPAPSPTPKPPLSLARASTSSSSSGSLGAMPNLAQASTPNTMTALILPFGGEALDAYKRYTPDSILRTMPKYGLSGAKAAVDSGDVAQVGLLLCAQTGADLLLGGTISNDQNDPGTGWSFNVYLDLQVSDCKHLSQKPREISETATNGNMQTAIDIAVDQALRSIPNAHTAAAR